MPTCLYILALVASITLTLTMPTSAQKHFKTLNLAEAKVAMLSEKTEPYFSVLQSTEIAALSGAAVSQNPLPEQRAELKKLFVSYLREFDQEENRAFEKLCKHVDQQYKKILPLAADIPWRLIKVDDRYCSGFLHTREDYIVMPQKFVSASLLAITEDSDGENFQRVCRLLLHEKLHIAQRIHAVKFRKLYRDLWGFEHIGEINQSTEMTQRMVNNPDALDLGFAIQLDNKYYWARVLFKKGVAIPKMKPKMGRDFQNSLIPIEKKTIAKDDEDDEEKWTVSGEDALEIGFPKYKHKFTSYAFQRGGDHPHEILAYSLEQIAGYVPIPKSDQPKLKQIEKALADMKL